MPLKTVADERRTESSHGDGICNPLTFDIKGTVCVALNVLCDIILLQNSLRDGPDAILTLRFLVIRTVFCTNSSMA